MTEPMGTGELVKRLRVPRFGAIDALAAYQQADEDGVMVLVSRQAIEECLPALRVLAEAADALEAAERTRAEERAHATKALKLAQEMQDKAVAAERERADEADRQRRIVDSHYRQQHDANLKNIKRAEAAEAKLARLENPDEALVEAVAKWHCENDWPCRMCRENAEESIRALARTLEGKENSDG